MELIISRAQIRNNKAFFKRLRAALAGPSKKEWQGLGQMHSERADGEKPHALFHLRR